MSNVKFSPNLFLGESELNRFKKSMREEGFQFLLQSITEKFGIIRNRSLDPNFSFFKVETGNFPNTIKINEGYAFDKFGGIIHQKNSAPNTLVLDGDLWFWVKISQRYSSQEVGTISIGGLNKGLMTGVGTKFKEILRGQPNYPSKIKFDNSTRYNQLEYEILEVLDDQNALVQGVFDTVETGLSYSVIGTFTPGHYPQADEKNIFEYDDCLITLVPEVIDETAPVGLKNQEFFIARIKNSTSVGMIIQDKRSECLAQSTTDIKLDNVTTLNNLIGIESILSLRYNNAYKIGFDWKFNITSETRNLQNNLISISSGKGGSFKTTADFSDGNFDGWNYHYSDGTFTRVLKSVKNNNNIDLYVEDVKEGITGTIVAPNATEIEIKGVFKNIDGGELFTKTWLFAIDSIKPHLDVEAFHMKGFPVGTTQTVDLTWRHKLIQASSKPNVFNKSTFYTEEAFNIKGVLIDVTKILTQINPKIGFLTQL